VANDEAPPAHVDTAPDAEGGDPNDSGDDSGDDDGDNMGNFLPQKPGKAGDEGVFGFVLDKSCFWLWL
jgi:hypothetical protein